MMNLAEGLVGGDTAGGGEVEGAEDLALRSGDTRLAWQGRGSGAHGVAGDIGETILTHKVGYAEVEGGGDGVTDGIRDPSALGTEDQAIAVGEARVPEAARGLGGKEPETARAGGSGKESGPVDVVPDIEGVPVIHAGAAQFGVGDLKAKRMDEVEGAAGEGAHTPDIPRVLRNLGVVQDEV
jgi:hypothetical protein